MKRMVPLWSQIFVLLFLVAAPALAQDQMAPAASEPDLSIEGPFDLARCVKRALAVNPTIVAAKAELEGSEHGIKSARGDFGPSATINYGYTYYDRKPTVGNHDYWAANLNLTQPIFTGFRLLSTYQKAKLTKEHTDAKLYNVQLSVLKDVQTNFLALLKGRMDVKSAEDSVARLKSQLETTTAFYEVGLKPRVDVYDAEVELASAEQDLLTARNTVSVLESKLNTLLAIPLTQKINYMGELAYTPFSLTFDECLKRAYANRPDLVMGQKSVEMAMKDADIASSPYYPQVSGQFNYNKAGDDPTVDGGNGFSHAASDYWTAGVDVSWNVWKWGADYYGVKQAESAVRQMQALLEDTRLNAGYEVEQAISNLEEAADRITVAEKAVNAAAESYRMAEARYKNEVGTSTDVLNAQARLTQAEAQHSQALADYGTALASLYVAMGEMNHSLAPR